MASSGKKSILYIINFYGTPPLNYFEKYIKKNNISYLTILKLPAIRSKKNRLVIDAFIKDENDVVHPMNINLFFPFPYFLIFFVQYVINFIILFLLLNKIKRRKFDIGIGETNFGSAIVYFLKKIGKVHYGVFNNGDILPDPLASEKCYFLSNTASRFHTLYKFIDTLIINIQFQLKRLGYRNDLIWYGNYKVEKWDQKKGLIPKQKIIYDTIKIDYNEFLNYAKVRKTMSDLCYIGRLDDFVGLDIVIPSLATIKNKVPDIKLHIIGGNEVLIDKYRILAEKSGVGDRVVFYGYLPKMEDAFDIMSKCSLGLALYKPVSNNVSMHAQPAKPKEYIKVGLPILLSKGGPEIGQEIVKHNAGVEVEFDKKKVSETIIKVITNKALYGKLQTGVKTYAFKEDFNSHFETLFKNLENLVAKNEII